MLAEVNNATASRNPNLNSQPSDDKRLQSSSLLQINNQNQVSAELKLLSKGIVSKEIGIKVLHHSSIQSHH